MAGFLAIFGVDKDSEGVKTTTILFAVLFVYVLDFAINVSKLTTRVFLDAVGFSSYPLQYKRASGLSW